MATRSRPDRSSLIWTLKFIASSWADTSTMEGLKKNATNSGGEVSPPRGVGAGLGVGVAVGTGLGAGVGGAGAGGVGVGGVGIGMGNSVGAGVDITSASARRCSSLFS